MTRCWTATGPCMRLQDYQNAVRALPHGKRLPNAVYVYRGDGVVLDGVLNALVDRLAEVHGVGPDYNVVKFRTNAPRLSFLRYADFVEDPHPTLMSAVSVDLAKGKARPTDYADNVNPPILHRKEAMLPLEHPRRAEYEALTQAEEAEGLYTETATIGFRLNWDRLLEQRGLYYEGHQLRRREGAPPLAARPAEQPIVQRHKTALARYELSKPVRTLLEHGLLRPDTTFFDYGCGLGADIKGLLALGHQADGWDPVHRPEASEARAAIVNLGYVLNVIEDPAERLETLVRAHELAERLLVVSALINETVDTDTAVTYSDGVLTNRSTFQKYFEQQELQQYIEDALEVTAVPVALGIFYVFRDPIEEQEFLQRRNRRVIDWAQIRLKTGLSYPEDCPRRVRARLDPYEQHAELLEAYWSRMLKLGRPPTALEFDRYEELRQALRSPRRAERFLFKRHGPEPYQLAQAARKSDLLVYLALANLRKRVPFSHLPPSLRIDIKTFHGDYRRAMERGRDLLFAAGDPDEIELACEDASVGCQDAQALYVCRRLLDRLPPLLRAYVACAEALYGDVRQADLIKLHKASGKVTFLLYDDFEDRPLPELRLRIKVNLRNRWVQAFDHSAQGQLLYFKERFLEPEHPDAAAMRDLSQELQRHGVQDRDGLASPKPLLQAVLQRAGRSDLISRCFPDHAHGTTTPTP
jgi:DNA phosphorothioation-associated putative methyltransferase